MAASRRPGVLGVNTTSTSAAEPSGGSSRSPRTRPARSGDEDTAGIVGPDHVLEVIGRGSVTIIDGSASETDAWEVGGHRPLMISNVVLHSLPAGYRFDLRRHRIAPPRCGPPGGEAAST